MSVTALSARVTDVAERLYSQAWRVTRRGDTLTITSREGTPHPYTSEHLIDEAGFTGTDYAEYLADAHAMRRSYSDN